MKDPLKFGFGHEKTEANTFYRMNQGYVDKRCLICRKEREKKRTQLLAAFKPSQREKKEKYRGEKAGRITIPSYRWGGTRLG